MTRKTQRKRGRRSLTLRLAKTGYDHIAGRAKQAGVDVSTMHRRMLAYAAANMPADYIPVSEREK